MADVATGSFFGYRELPISDNRGARSRPQSSPWPPKLSLTLIEHLGDPSYDYRCYYGIAPDDYGVWTWLPWRCRMIKIMVQGSPLEIQISYNGEQILDTRLLRQATTTLDSFAGFRVRQQVAGSGTWYQLLAML